MSGGTADRTNAMRRLEACGASYTPLTVPLSGAAAVSAVEAARLLRRGTDEVFKTLVTVGRSREHYVFVVPGGRELDLRKAARAVGEKSVEMVRSKELLPLTGYVHGGCSPVGMKKPFRTVVAASAEGLATIVVSAGKIGQMMELSLEDLRRAVDFTTEDLTAERAAAPS